MVVSVAPGPTEFTLTPNLDNSIAAHFVSMSRQALDTLNNVHCGRGMGDAETFTTHPLFSFSHGAAIDINYIGPLTLTVMTWSNSYRVVSL
jgi:hypothetical protein